MPQVTFLYPSGATRALDIPVGKSVMQGAIAGGIDGIVAECGGELVCATCHVFVLSASGPLPLKGDLEDEMLDSTIVPRRENSRLSCQLKLTAEVERVTVELPEAQV